MPKNLLSSLSLEGVGPPRSLQCPGLVAVGRAAIAKAFSTTLNVEIQYNRFCRHMNEYVICLA